MEFRQPRQIWKDPSTNIVDFGRVFAIGVFLIGALLQWYAAGWQYSWSAFSEKTSTSFPWWLAGGLMITLTSITPWLLRPIYFLWMLLGQSMGWVIQKIILGAIFYGLFTPIGLLYRRWCGVITKNADPNCKSYWEKKNISTAKNSYYRQF